MIKFEYKVPGGKLIKVFVSIKNGVIEEIKITGDFFLHPEESIEILEEKLKGINVNEETKIRNVLNEFFKSKTLIGATSEDFFLAL
ncbi:MAG: lipoate protein ligase C-terminal domain-containing protein, partial [Candidatus Bathyarchaeia archaeon]